MNYCYNSAGNGGPGPMVLLTVVTVGTGGGSFTFSFEVVQGGSNMTGTDLCVSKPHCAAAVRP